MNDREVADYLLANPEFFADHAELLATIAEQGLPDDPERLTRLLTTDGTTASPSHLHRIVERIREKEGAEAPARRAGWTRARGSERR